MNPTADPLTPRPHDLGNVSPRELLDAHLAHLAPLVDARHGLGRDREPARLRGAALDALATGAALVTHVESSRWITAAEALHLGATLADIAAALGMPDPDETADELISWADGQRRLNGDTGLGITADEYAHLIDLITEDQP